MGYMFYILICNIYYVYALCMYVCYNIAKLYANLVLLEVLCIVSCLYVDEVVLEGYRSFICTYIYMICRNCMYVCWWGWIREVYDQEYESRRRYSHYLEYSGHDRSKDGESWGQGTFSGGDFLLRAIKYEFFLSICLII